MSNAIKCIDLEKFNNTCLISTYLEKLFILNLAQKEHKILNITFLTLQEIQTALIGDIALQEEFDFLEKNNGNLDLLNDWIRISKSFSDKNKIKTNNDFLKNCLNTQLTIDNNKKAYILDLIKSKGKIVFINSQRNADYWSQYFKNNNINVKVENIDLKVEIDESEFTSKLKVFDNIDSQTEWICERIYNLIKKGTESRRIAILDNSGVLNSSLNRIGNVYGLNFLFKKSLWSIPFVQSWYKTFDFNNYKKKIFECDFFNQIPSVKNSLIEKAEEINKVKASVKLKKDYFKRIIKNFKITIPNEKKVNIDVITSLNEAMKKEIVFISNFSQNYFPLPVSNKINEITDNDIKELSLPTSEECAKSDIIDNNLFIRLKDNLTICYSKTINGKEQFISFLFKGDINKYKIQDVKNGYRGKIKDIYSASFNFPKSDFEKFVKPQFKKPFEFSYTQLDSYNGCPFKYYLERIIKLKDSNKGLIIGNVFHRVMEKWVNLLADSLKKNMLDNIKYDESKLNDFLLDLYKKELDIEFKSYPETTEIEKFFYCNFYKTQMQLAANSIFKLFVEFYNNGYLPIVATEREFNLTLPLQMGTLNNCLKEEDKILFNGKIDLIVLLYKKEDIKCFGKKENINSAYLLDSNMPNDKKPSLSGWFIIDYKTSKNIDDYIKNYNKNKSFGGALQLPTYLFLSCASNTINLKNIFGLYYKPLVYYENGKESKINDLTYSERAESNAKLLGFTYSDNKVLQSIGDDLTNYLPSTKNKKENKEKLILNEYQFFDQMFEKMKSEIPSIRDNIFCGKFNMTEDKETCKDYCSYKDICYKKVEGEV